MKFDSLIFRFLSVRIPLNLLNINVISGKHVTIVAHSRAVEISLEGAKLLAGDGIDCEVINLRSLRPLDEESITKSVMKTNHLISVEQGWPYGGIGAEIIARITESMSCARAKKSVTE